LGYRTDKNSSWLYTLLLEDIAKEMIDYLGATNILSIILTQF
jgi:hypothetical protein